MLIGADHFAPLIGVSGPAAGYLVGFAGLVIAIFGVGYAIVALDPRANRGLVVMGALGKASAVAFSSFHALAGHIPQSTYLLSTTDLIWAIAFAMFLRRTRSAAAPAAT